MTVIEHTKNHKQERKTEQAPGHQDHGAELERTLRHALALAVTEQAARRTLGGMRVRRHRGGLRTRLKSTGHLVGYGTLFGYIVYLTREAKQPEPVQAPSGVSSADPSVASVPAPS